MTGYPIDPYDKEAQDLGFTEDLFEGYLWKNDGEIMISLIFSREAGKGNFSKLVKRIEEAGYTVAVPTPIGKMPEILTHMGFKPNQERGDFGEMVHVWRKPA